MSVCYEREEGETYLDETVKRFARDDCGFGEPDCRCWHRYSQWINLEGPPRGGQAAAPAIQCEKRKVCRIEVTDLGGDDYRDEKEKTRTSQAPRGSSKLHYIRTPTERQDQISSPLPPLQTQIHQSENQGSSIRNTTPPSFERLRVYLSYHRQVHSSTVSLQY